MLINFRKELTSGDQKDGVLIGWKSDTYEKLAHLEITYDDVFARYKIRGA